jgi:hypothetical protein
MSKAAEYRAKAIDHAKLAAISQSEEVCEIHVRIAASFLALADKRAMRDLNPSGYPVSRYRFNVRDTTPQ